MSRPTSSRAVMVASIVGLSVCSLLWAEGAAGQQRGEEELLRNVEALLPGYEAALAARDARLERRESVERRPTPTDTAQVGPIRIVTIPDEIDVARDLFAEVWSEDFLGFSESPSLASHMFAFQWRTRMRSLEITPGPDEELLRVELSRIWAPTRDHAKAGIRDALAEALMQDFPRGSPMRGWLTARAYPDAATAYRTLATSTPGAAQECFEGVIDACQAALGLGFADAAGRIPQWFNPRERREMVGRVARYDRDPNARIDRDGPLYRGCVEENDAPACDRLLEGLAWVEWTPVSDRLRAHLLWTAILIGGDGAWQRARERGAAPMPEVLAHASGLPVEELLAVWRADLVAHRPDVHAGLGGRGTRVLLWSLIFAALAMRSTRWRLA